LHSGALRCTALSSSAPAIAWSALRALKCVCGACTQSVSTVTRGTITPGLEGKPAPNRVAKPAERVPLLCATAQQPWLVHPAKHPAAGGLAVLVVHGESGELLRTLELPGVTVAAVSISGATALGGGEARVALLTTEGEAEIRTLRLDRAEADKRVIQWHEDPEQELSVSPLPPAGRLVGRKDLGPGSPDAGPERSVRTGIAAATPTQYVDAPQRARNT
jgi:hypothetical protein